MSAIEFMHALFDTPLPTGWRLAKTDDIKSDEKSACVAGPFGSNISSKYFVEQGVPVIRGGNLKDDLTRFVPTGFVFVSDEQAQKYKAQHVRAGDLVFTCWGTIGQVGLIPTDGPFPQYIISNKQLKLRPNLRIADPEYLFFYYACPQMVGHIRNKAIGAAVPGINLGILKELPVVLPPMATQRRIASILSAYDDLIENCQRRIRLLEDMARGLYREWFVHFRFPGADTLPRVDSPLGLIPSGWRACTLSDLASYINRGIAPRYDEAGPSLVINQKCIREQRLSFDPARRQAKPIPSDKQIRYGDVLINSTGVGTLGRVAQVLEALVANCTVDTHVTIARPLANVDIHFFGMALLSRQQDFERLGVGATGQTELGRSAIGELLLPVADPGLQAAFGKAVAPMRQQCVGLAQKIANLRRTRDLLLPRLLSGQIDVGAAEASIPA